MGRAGKGLGEQKQTRLLDTMDKSSSQQRSLSNRDARYHRQK